MQSLARDERLFLGLCALIVLAQVGRAATSLLAAWRGPYAGSVVAESGPVEPGGEPALVSQAAR
jgi:hypothetical protein